MTSTMEETSTRQHFTRPSMKELVNEIVVNGTRAEFDEWLDRVGWGVRNTSVAKVALSTYIESRLEVKGGVWFGNQANIIHIGAREGLVLQIRVPAWMTDYIKSFPRPTWVR